ERLLDEERRLVQLGSVTALAGRLHGPQLSSLLAPVAGSGDVPLGNQTRPAEYRGPAHVGGLASSVGQLGVSLGLVGHPSSGSRDLRRVLVPQVPTGQTGARRLVPGVLPLVRRRGLARMDLRLGVVIGD